MKNNMKNVTKRDLASELRSVATYIYYGTGDTPERKAAVSFLRTAARNLEHGWSVEQMVGGKLTVGDLFQ